MNKFNKDSVSQPFELVEEYKNMMKNCQFEFEVQVKASEQATTKNDNKTMPISVNMK